MNFSVDSDNALTPANGVGAASGAESSALLLDANTSGVCFSDAAQQTFSFDNNDLNDWYLPSTDELIAIRELGLLPGEPATSYWSSTEDSSTNAFLVLVRVETNPFDDGNPVTSIKTETANVLPVRTF